MSGIMNEAMRTFIISIAVAVFLLTSLLIVSLTKAQEVNFESKKVDYALPYPGLLPDNPLYAIKKIRDTVLIFFSRNNVRKVELYFLFSDKKIYMASELAKKGKWNLVSQTTTEAQSDFLKVAELLRTSKKQGTSAPSGLIQKIKLSNEKHREVIEMLLKNAPTGERVPLEKALATTKTIREQLASF